RQELAQICFGLFGDGDERLATMAHLHDRHASATPVEKLVSRLLEDFGGKDGWSRTEIVNARHECVVDPVCDKKDARSYGPRRVSATTTLATTILATTTWRAGSHRPRSNDQTSM